MRKGIIFWACCIGMGCFGVVIKDKTERDQHRYAIKTEKEEYDVRIFDEDIRTISIDIASTYINSTTEPVFLKGCSPPAPPALEKQMGSEWIVLYSPIVFLCESPPLRVMPGETIELHSSYVGYPAGDNDGNGVDGEMNGVFRFRQAVFSSRDGYEQIPLELRISNTFKLHEVKG